MLAEPTPCATSILSAEEYLENRPAIVGRAAHVCHGWSSWWWEWQQRTQHAAVFHAKPCEIPDRLNGLACSRSLSRRTRRLDVVRACLVVRCDRLCAAKPPSGCEEGWRLSDPTTSCVHQHPNLEPLPLPQPLLHSSTLYQGEAHSQPGGPYGSFSIPPRQGS